MAGVQPSICYDSKESKQTVSAELGQPHKPDIKALCKHWHCCINLLQLSWYEMEDQRHLDPARIGNAYPTLLPCSALLYECLVHPGNEESQQKGSWECCIFLKKGRSHTGLLLLGAVRTENCTWGYFPPDGKGHCLTKQGYRLPSIPLHWQLNKPLSHIGLCFKKLVWFRMIWVEENIPLKDPAWASQWVEGGRVSQSLCKGELCPERRNSSPLQPPKGIPPAKMEN